MTDGVTQAPAGAVEPPTEAHSRWSGRAGAAVAAVTLGATTAAVVVTTTPWTTQPAPAGGRTPVDPGRDFTRVQIAREDAFHHAVQPWSYAALLLGLAVTAVLGLTPLGPRLVGRLGRRWAWQALAGGAVLTLLGLVVQVPFLAHDEAEFRRFGLSTQTWGAWAGDLVKTTALGTGITAVALLGFFGLTRLAPRTWWLWTAVSGATLVLASSYAYPVLVEPLFTHFHPMPAGPMRTSLLDLAHHDGVGVSDVLVADASRRTTSLNAYVSGFGDTRRIVVYDTLLRQATPQQVRLVVAHELGHAKRDDVLHGTIVGALGVSFACCLGYLLLTSRWASRTVGATDREPDTNGRRRAGVAGDPRSAALVLLFVAVASLAATPVQSLVSRRIEARADVHSLDLTRDPATFRDMQRTLSVTNLSDLDPQPLAYGIFADHPTGPERIALARDWSRRHGVPTP